MFLQFSWRLHVNSNDTAIRYVWLKYISKSPLHLNDRYFFYNLQLVKKAITALQRVYDSPPHSRHSAGLTASAECRSGMEITVIDSIYHRLWGIRKFLILPREKTNQDEVNRDQMVSPTFLRHLSPRKRIRVKDIVWFLSCKRIFNWDKKLCMIPVSCSRRFIKGFPFLNPWELQNWWSLNLVEKNDSRNILVSFFF